METVAPASSRGARGRATASAGGGEPPRPLHEVATRPAERLSVGIAEVDRVLGGGLVPGALVLLGGEPGIGKSTLVLEIAAGVARAGAGGVGAGPEVGTDVLYASGEESADQLHLRADRLGLTAGLPGARIQVLAETALDAILAAAERIGPGLLVVDSVQTLTSDGLEGPAGSVGQVRESAARLAAWSHEQGIRWSWWAT